MADNSSPRRFSRIERLPPYVFNITSELKMAARRRGEDIIDFSMGNPDGPTPPHIVEKLCTVARREDTHGYSTSRGIPACAAPFHAGMPIATRWILTRNQKRLSPSGRKRDWPI